MYVCECLLLICFICFAALLLFYRTRNYTGSRQKNLKKHPRSRTEQGVIDILESITGKKFPTINPKWLRWRGRTLELDGYNVQLAIALEFSGPLHTKWFPGKESYKKYYERVIKDEAKKEICARNGVTLIVIDMSLPSRHWRNYLLSRLYDVGIGDEPVIYIEQQTAEPFRNPQLERELQ